MSCSERSKELRRRQHRKKKVAGFARKLQKATVSERAIIADKLRNLTPGGDTIVVRWELEKREGGGRSRLREGRRANRVQRLAWQVDIFFFCGLAQLVHGAGLDLADSFLRHAQFGAHLFERQWLLAAAEAESPDNDPLLALVEPFENPLDLASRWVCTTSSSNGSARSSFMLVNSSG